MSTLLALAVTAMSAFAVLMSGILMPISGLPLELAAISFAASTFVAVVSATSLDT